ncbi:Flp pilus assembly protein CpaB [Altererythrobacter soli]|uniref:Flp pilus assembly protein CpaB n=1 Tax=Croceibacterium soli TaxID=1739690 RepID=A0A6I4US52_9SPHN|nr:Flp pilus assembly protein CpaB [Croceibacterium soli]MXP41621.1 Flp pilus assembly protein CpaB [Croceibacterium soli]
MERRNLIIVGVAVVLGLMAVYFANAWFSGVEQRQERVAEEQQLVRVAVANQDLQFGSPLTRDNVRVANWPADSVPQGAYRDSEFDRLLSGGNVAIRPIARGEPILLSRISERAVLSANIPEGMRAVTVPVDAVSGVAGFVTPGDVVDVMLTRQMPGEGASGDDKMVSIILESVPVLAIDLRADEQNSEAAVGRTATLQATPRDAQKLVLATQVGRLSLALRNIESLDNGSRATVTTRDLGGGYYIRGRSSAPVQQVQTVRASAPAVAGTAASAAAPAPRRPSGPTMVVVRGVDTTNEEVQRYGS